MKIDLHIHTETNNKKGYGEPENRNIDYQKLIEILDDNNVGIAAITNHNLFNKEYFINACNEIEKRGKDILLLPGVELDILRDKESKERRQLNLIFNWNKNYDNDNLLDNFLSIIDKFNKTDKEIENLLEEFNYLNKEIILYLDVKSNEKNLKRWSDNEIEELIKKLKNYKSNDKNKFGIICDVNNYYSLFRYRSRGRQTLIGSDIQNWENYNEASKKLLDTSLDVTKQFDIFFKIFVYPNVNQEIFDQIFENDKKYEEIKDVKLNINNKDINVGNLKIYEGINIIFGPKASGKSLILKEIEEKTKNRNIFYDPSKIETNEQKYINGLLEKIYFPEINKFKNEKCNNIKVEFNKKINSIIDFQDIEPIKFEKILNSLDTKKMKITDYFKYDYDSNENKENIECLEKSIENLNNSYKELEKFNSDKSDKFKIKLLQKIKKISNELISKYINEMKKNWKFDLYNNIYKEIEKKYLFLCGKQIKIEKINLYDRWKKRNELKKIIKEIKNNEWNISEENYLKINLKDRGKIYLKIEFKTYDFKTGKDTKNKKNKDFISYKDFKEIYDKIFDEQKIINVVNNIKTIREKLISFIKNPFIYEYSLLDENKEIFSPSNGEKAILSLYINLNQEEKDFYLLDEPETYLNITSIFDILIEEIWNKCKLKKKIVICTHNPALAINSIPYNMIYREKQNDDNGEYKTYTGNALTQKFININNPSEEPKKFNELLLEQFEGSKENFDLRGDIYMYGKNRH